MRHFSLTGLALGCLLVPAAAHAQGPGPYVRPQTNPYARPAFSPYLNLLNNNNNPAVNYYGLVRPEIDTRNSLLQLQQQINTLPTTPGVTEPGSLPVTGHPTQFLNYTHFYPSGIAGAAGRRPSGPQAAPTQPTAAPATGGAASRGR